MSTPFSNNDRVRAAYSGEAARRRLAELRPSLYRATMDFARSGKPATARTVTRWLASQGTFGAVDSLAAEILANLPDARAALAEFGPA
jgi:hypothetical protein